MRGAEIVKIGSVDDDGLEGGGLLIDYIPRGSDCIRRVVFAFNELGLWIEGEAERQLLDEL
jgi:hypothetical protein